MQTLTIQASPPAAFAEPGSTLRTVIFYEDAKAGARALAIYEQVERQLARELKMTCTLWRFDMLAALPLKTAAAADMAEAQLIVFSAHAGFLPGGSLRELVEQWLADHATPDCALAALIDCTGCAPDQPVVQLRDYLREKAHRHHLAFFLARYLPHPEAPVSRLSFEDSARPGEYGARRLGLAPSHLAGRSLFEEEITLGFHPISRRDEAK